MVPCLRPDEAREVEPVRTDPSMPKWLARWLSALVLGAGLLLAGCASAPVPPVAQVEPLFDDAVFAPPSQRIDADDVLALSPRMKHYLDTEIKPQLHWQSTTSGLIEALYTRGRLKLAYDTELTRSASQAFDDRAGNCLSLVLMTAAFARELGLTVRFQSVVGEDSWGREGGLLLFVGHVNIAIGPTGLGGRLSDRSGDWVTVDFLPNVDLQRQRRWPIGDARIVAMYMNNKSAEALAGGRIDDAYWWSRAAILQDRSFTAAYNTLGVVYLRRGLSTRAEMALRFVLTQEAENPHALSNLVLALQQQGRDSEAQAVAAQLQRLPPSTPFAYFELGQKAMRGGDIRQARRHFERAVRHADDYHEFHFALAQALALLGETEAAAKHLERAQENSGTRRLQSMYAGKLMRLRERLAH